ncbi:MAG: GNAT family N-acetyltransferase [bacterium]|nr:GNAT family N-acetyltransferase [bacterium]
MKTPKFSKPIRAVIKNYITGENYTLNSVDGSFRLTDRDYSQITKICNEPDIYNLLFRERFKGRKYVKQDARIWMSMAKQGWEESSNFIFLVRDNNGSIVGAIDIKSPDLSGAEIGYWASAYARGFMTNTLKKLCKIAEEAGYSSLFALILSRNLKSIGVIKRSGFKNLGLVNERGKDFCKYQILLGHGG